MIKIIAILTIFFLTAKPFAQLSNDKIVGDALEDYGVIAGAWHLNNHCKILSESLANELENNVAAITVAMRNDLKNQKMLLDIQSSSKSIIDKEPYSKCQEEARKVITETVILARNWVQGIGSATNNLNSTGLSEIEIKRYSALVAAYHIEENCKFGPDQDLADIQLMLNAIRKALSNRGVEMEPLNMIGIGVRNQIQKGPYSECNDETKSFTSRVRNGSWEWVRQLTEENPHKVNKASNPTP